MEVWQIALAVGIAVCSYLFGLWRGYGWGVTDTETRWSFAVARKEGLDRVARDNVECARKANP